MGRKWRQYYFIIVPFLNMSEQGTNWVFTLNNPTLSGEALITLLEVDPKVKGCVFQLESGAKTGTPHFQGYIRFKQNMRTNAVCQLLTGRARVAVRRGTHDEALDYVIKSDTKIEGPWQCGDMTDEQGKRNDLVAVKRMLDEGAKMSEIADAHFGSYLRYNRGFVAYKRLKVPARNWKTEVVVICGPPGTGKTRKAWDEAPEAYPKQVSQWWCDYDGHEAVVLDDFYGWLKWTTLLQLCDRYPMLVETKGGQVAFLAKKVYITSNTAPDTWYKSENIDFRAFVRRVTKWVYMGVDNMHETEDYEEFTRNYFI